MMFLIAQATSLIGACVAFSKRLQTIEAQTVSLNMVVTLSGLHTYKFVTFKKSV